MELGGKGRVREIREREIRERGIRESEERGAVLPAVE